MPFIDLQLGHPVTLETRQLLARRTTEIIVKRLLKRHEVTAVRVTHQAADAWCIGASPISPALCPVHAEIFITAGTNDEAQKAACIADLHALLGEVLGPLPEASYLIIKELPATDWGYAGHTQAARRNDAR